MKKFVMSKYATLEHLHAAKADYYEKLCTQLLQVLQETELVRWSESTGEWYWTATGENVELEDN